MMRRAEPKKNNLVVDSAHLENGVRITRPEIIE